MKFVEILLIFVVSLMLLGFAWHVFPVKQIQLPTFTANVVDYHHDIEVDDATQRLVDEFEARQYITRSA